MEYPLFLQASDQATRTFNISEMIGSTVGGDLSSDFMDVLEAPADMFVPGATQFVKISKYVLLRQMIRVLRLKVHGFGIVIESAMVYCGWIDLDMPRCSIDGKEEHKKFYSDEMSSRFDAIENACGVAINYLTKNCDIVIEDANHAEAKALKNKAADAELWNYIMCSSVDAKKREAKGVQARCADLFAEAVSICSDFGDVLSVAEVEADGSPTGVGRPVYVGISPPVTRLEMLAVHLLGVLNKGVRI